MNGMLKRTEKQNRRKRKKIEIGLLAEINLTAQDAHGAHEGHDNGGESYINHHIETFLYNKKHLFGWRKANHAYLLPSLTKLLNGRLLSNEPCKGTDSFRPTQPFPKQIFPWVVLIDMGQRNETKKKNSPPNSQIDLHQV